MRGMYRDDYIDTLIDEICKTVPWATKERMSANSNPYLRILAHKILDDAEKEHKITQEKLDKMHQHFIDNMPL